MKVGVVAEWLDRSRGGAEWSTSQFIDALRNREIVVEVVTRSRPQSAPGFLVHTIDAPTWPRSAGTARFLAAAEAYARSSDCDLVHAMVPCPGAHVYQPRGGLAAETNARTLASRAKGWPREIKRLDLALNRRQKLVLRKERRWLGGSPKPVVIAISAYVARQLREHHDYPDHLIYCIQNGVSVQQADHTIRLQERDLVRQRHRIKDEEFVILAVCHNFRLKGVGPLIEAVGRLAKESKTPVRAIVVGRDKSSPWKSLAIKHGVGNSIVFTGPIEQVRPYYHGADVLVHATYYDPCSRVTLEAMNYGLIVVTTRHDGASEQVEAAEAGFVIDSPENMDELVRVLSSIIVDKDRNRMREAEPAGLGRWTMQSHADEVISVYKRILEFAPAMADKGYQGTPQQGVSCLSIGGLSR